MGLDAIDARDGALRRVRATRIVCRSKPVSRNTWGTKSTMRRTGSAVPNAIIADIVNAESAKNAPPQNNARTTGFVTAAEN